MVIYETITELIAALKKIAVTIDLNLGLGGAQSLQPIQIIPQASDKCKIIVVHRFEGNTDPDNEASV